jgi:hypothetical protein
MTTEQQIEKIKDFLNEFFLEIKHDDIWVVPETDGDCSFYMPVSRLISYDDEPSLDTAMDALLEIYPYKPDSGDVFVFLLCREKVVYSWSSHP